MRWKQALLATLMLTMVSTTTAQERFERSASTPRATEIPTEGFWPTRKMMERIIDRIVDQMVKHYDLDDEQSRLTRELFKARYPEYLNENRAEIQSLLNQYFEALLNDEAPDPEEVAEWALRAQPVLAGLGEMTHETMDVMREYFNDDQTVMLDAELTAFDAGLRMAQNKLSVWADGGYDPETEWIRPPKENRAGGSAAEQPPEDEAPDDERQTVTTSAPEDEWTVYTRRFIERYQLNDEQRQKAFQILRRQQEARDRYLRRKVDEMAQVTRLLTEAATEEDRQASLRAYEQLNAPVNQIFQRLQERLETLPTRAQRKAAEEAGLTAENHAPAEPLTVQPTEAPRESPPRP